MKEQCSNCLYADVNKGNRGILTSCRYYPPVVNEYYVSQFPLVKVNWKCSLWEYYDLYLDGVNDKQYRPEYFKLKGAIK